MDRGVVIVGGGQAGVEAAAGIRRAGYGGPVRMICAEPVAPYQRPPLSKGFLLGKIAAEALRLRAAEFYENQSVELMLGREVTAIDRRARRLVLENGEALDFSALMLATGARVRRLGVPGADHEAVLYLRDLADARLLKERLADAERVAVIGGGFIGLEVAAVARGLGKEVTVIEAAPRLMARAVGQPISDFYARHHQEHGLELRLSASVERLVPDGRGLSIQTGDGGRVLADLAVVGIGVVPNDELAQAAGLPTSGGILVDAEAATADEAIFSAGDCTMHPNAFTGTSMRLESVQNAVDQGRIAGQAAVGRREPYKAVPWFWSDQYGTRLQMAGFSSGHDGFAYRGDPESGRFSVFYFRDGRLIGAESVSRPADHMAARRLLAAGTALTPDQARDESLPLASLLKPAVA